jgi:hypothetical protein
MRGYLSQRFDPDVLLFFDREAIDAGSAFPARLHAAVDGCRVLIAVIGPDCLEATDIGGRRRLDEEQDWVRGELALALALGKAVIPVLFGDDTPPPPRERLPESLQPLASLQMKRLRGDRSEYDAQRDDLVRILAAVPGVPPPHPDRTQPVIGIPPDQLASIIAAATGDWKQLTDEQRQTIDSLKQRIDVGEGAVRAFFRTLGEAEVRPEQQEPRLVEIARQYKDLQQQLSGGSGDEPEIARLKELAREALDDGELERADSLLADALDAEDAAIDQRRLAAAATAARRGDIAREGSPLNWADIQHNLGNALRALGEMQAGTDRLQSAVTAFQAAQEEFTRERKPLDRAAAEECMGKALQILGERTADPTTLHRARDAVRAALELYMDAGQEHRRPSLEARLRQLEEGDAKAVEHAR